MEVKTGYKKTDIGIIPNDWNNYPLLNKAILKARIGWQGLTTAEYKLQGDYFLVTGTEFNDGYIDWDTCFYVGYERYKQDKNIQLKTNDVLVTKDGTIGKVAFINLLPKLATLNSGVFVIRPINDFFDSKFFYYLLRSKYFENFLNKLAAGSTISHLYQKDFIHFRFPLPPTLEEQRAIATALSDTDELISSLDKLITKKRNIKQATMQQLLTGKKRLPGFSGEWEVKKLKDVTNTITCGIAATPKYVKPSVGVPFLSGTNIKNGKIRWKGHKYISKELHSNLYRNNPPLRGDILYTRVGTIGEAAIVEVDIEFSIYVSLTLIKVKNILDSCFLMHLLNSNPYKQKAKNEVYLGGGVGNLNVDVVREFEMPIPLLEEQQLISQILSDMASEIEALEQKRDKYKAIKQGMMQQLLTGKTRLI